MTALAAIAGRYSPFPIRVATAASARSAQQQPQEVWVRAGLRGAPSSAPAVARYRSREAAMPEAPRSGLHRSDCPQLRRRGVAGFEAADSDS